MIVAMGVAYWVVSITARSPLVYAVSNETPANIYVYHYCTSNFRILSALPWIAKALRVSTWVIRFAAIVPGTNLTTVQLARIKSGDEILFARGTTATRFARYSKVAPSAFTFCVLDFSMFFFRFYLRRFDFFFFFFE